VAFAQPDQRAGEQAAATDRHHQHIRCPAELADHLPRHGALPATVLGSSKAGTGVAPVRRASASAASAASS